MPLARIKYRQCVVGRGLVEQIAHELPAIVQKHMHVHNNILAKLLPEDIEVELRETDSGDVHAPGMGIIIWVPEFPERKKNVQERTDKIKGDVVRLIQRLGIKSTGYVWVRLAPSGFAAF